MKLERITAQPQQSNRQPPSSYYVKAVEQRIFVGEEDKENRRPKTKKKKNLSGKISVMNINDRRCSSTAAASRRRVPIEKDVVRREESTEVQTARLFREVRI